MGSVSPSYKVYPKLVFKSSPIPPDCWRDEKMPIKPPIGFCCWGWLEDCWDWDCCWGLKSMLAIEARLPMSNWGNCWGGCCCWGGW